MRFCVTFQLEHEEIPLDYRSCFLSYFKNAFINYSQDIYEKLYRLKDPIIKPFTFSVFLGTADFGHQIIKVADKKMKLNFSTSQAEYGIHFYNAMLNMKESTYPFGSNKIRMAGLHLLKDKPVTGNRILVKTMSPVIIRKHDREKNYDTYYGFIDQGYLEVLKENIYGSAKGFFDFDIQRDVRELEILPVDIKETMVLYHGHKIKGNVGKFVMKGKPYLLSYLLDSGCGARRSNGFGMLELEGEG